MKEDFDDVDGEIPESYFVNYESLDEINPIERNNNLQSNQEILENNNYLNNQPNPNYYLTDNQIDSNDHLGVNPILTYTSENIGIQNNNNYTTSENNPYLDNKSKAYYEQVTNQIENSYLKKQSNYYLSDENPNEMQIKYTTEKNQSLEKNGFLFLFKSFFNYQQKNPQLSDLKLLHPKRELVH